MPVTVGRKRRYRKRRAVIRRRMPRFRKSGDLCTLNRFVIKEYISGNDANPAFSRNLEFLLSDVPQVDDIRNMFEKYQFFKVQYRFVLTRDPAFATNTKGNFVRIMHVIDHDSAANDVVPQSFLELQQYQNVKEIWLNDSKPVSRWYSLRPNTLTLTYAGATSDYKHEYLSWLDTARTGAKHYGVRFYGDALQAGLFIAVECRYHMRVKGVH